MVRTREIIMICYTHRLSNLSQVILVLAALVLLIGLPGCGSLKQQYAGYKVIDKELKTESRKVPIRVTSCVTPQGRVICERRYGAFTECTLACKTPQNTWVERPEGYGGYEEKTFIQYLVTLQSPSGKVEKRETSEGQYNQVSVGQILGDGLNESGGVLDQKVPAATERISLADAQRKLATLGFDAGPPDGTMGPRTSRALQAFQKARNISISGQLDDATMRELLR